MTSIPVRKGTGMPMKSRSGTNKDNDEHSPPHSGNGRKDPVKTRARYNSKEDHNEKHRPLTRKELAEENSLLKTEIKDHENRLKELEVLLRIEKEKTSALKKDSSKKETEYTENLSDLNKKSDVLESKLEAYETKLLKCNIDPVSLENLDPDEKDNEAQTRYEQAMLKVKLIQEKFSEFNLHALQNIDSLQEIDTQLDEVITNCQSITTNDETTGKEA